MPKTVGAARRKELSPTEERVDVKRPSTEEGCNYFDDFTSLCLRREVFYFEVRLPRQEKIWDCPGKEISYGKG